MIFWRTPEFSGLRGITKDQKGQNLGRYARPRGHQRRSKAPKKEKPTSYTSKMTSKKEKKYNQLCARADKILIDSGIREICVACSRSGKGCCHGCRHLGRNGCRVRALACKLWLCDEKLEDKITLVGLSRQWRRLKAEAQRLFECTPSGSLGNPWFRASYREGVCRLKRL